MNCFCPCLHLPVAPLLAGDIAKVMAALTGHEPLNRKPPETSVNSEDLLLLAGTPQGFQKVAPGKRLAAPEPGGGGAASATRGYTFKKFVPLSSPAERRGKGEGTSSGGC